MFYVKMSTLEILKCGLLMPIYDNLPVIVSIPSLYPREAVAQICFDVCCIDTVHITPRN